MELFIKNDKHMSFTLHPYTSKRASIKPLYTFSPLLTAYIKALSNSTLPSSSAHCLVSLNSRESTAPRRPGLDYQQVCATTSRQVPVVRTLLKTRARPVVVLRVIVRRQLLVTLRLHMSHKRFHSTTVIPTRRLSFKVTGRMPLCWNL